MAPTAFADKIGLVLKALSLSRGRVAAELRISKSLVSRWVSGANTPAPHNLIALTELVAGRSPGFALLDWDREPADLAARLGVSLAEASAAPDEHDDVFGEVRARSQQEVGQEGAAYPGIYISFRLSLRNSGALVPDIFALWREGERLMFRQIGPYWSSRGEVMLLRKLLYFLCVEEREPPEQLAFLTLNGVFGHKAIRLDGLLMSVSVEVHRTPGVTPVVLQRLADLEDPAEAPSETLIEQIRARMRAAYLAGDWEKIVGSNLVAAVRPLVGAPDPQGGVDHLLRRPAERSLAASETGWTAELEADVRRLRRALLEVDDCYPVVG
jgi:hypothetical protein